jgi:hypothetical protein
MAYHIYGLYAPQKNWGSDKVLTKRMIKFRQHESTVDGNMVENWIRFCVGVVEFARTTNLDALFRVLVKDVNDTPDQFGIEKVLHILRMGNLADYYAELAVQRKLENPNFGAVEIESIVSPPNSWQARISNIRSASSCPPGIG